MEGPYTVGLGEVTLREVPLVGVKAGNLGTLRAAGFPVPDGFVLTTRAFERFVGHHDLDASTSPEDVLGVPIPEDVLAAVWTAAKILGDVPLAVRSSGVAEDLAGASFAGLYETVLGVLGREAIAAAIRRCWSSAFGPRVIAYRATRGDDGIPPIAVLVQIMVEASAAGVAFTSNPVTGDRGEVLVSAVRGLGDALVSGTAQPDEWVVRGSEVVCLRSPEGALQPSEVTVVADMARQAKTHFGLDQDVEWAISDGQVYLVQARPITALPDPPAPPIPVPADPPPGFWQREGTHAPRPISPLFAHWVIDGQNASFREMFQTFGLLADGLEFREIGGWIYTRLVPLGGRDRRPPPGWLMWLLVRSVPRLRSRTRACREAIRSDLHGQTIESWYREWRPDLAERIHHLATVDLPHLSDAHLDAHVVTLCELADECVRLHFLLHGAMVLVLGEFLVSCEDLLGWSDQETMRLLSGISEMSSEPARALAELASMAMEDPAVVSLLTEVGPDTRRQLSRSRPAFGAALEEYLTGYGCRALRYDPVDPTLAESPELVLRLIRDQIERGYDPTADRRALEEARSAAIDEARSAAREAGDLPGFERALRRAQRAYPVREDSEFYTASAPIGLLRYGALELGRRLADRDRIDRAEDVFWLRFPEALAALRDAEDRHAMVDRRRRERAWVEAHPGPPSYGIDPGPPPSLAALPKESRFAMEALQAVLIDRILALEESARQQAQGDRLVGIAAAPGRYTGPVRMVMSEAEFSKIEPGDVLVCPITSPVWSVLFPSVGALVTDTGGVLSHAAIIAREYRLPAVVATGNATTLLTDGQIVTVDGGRGTVEISALVAGVNGADTGDVTAPRA